MRLSRRHFLGLVGVTGAAFLAPGCELTRPRQTGEMLTTAGPLPEPFSVPLPIPPVAEPIRSGAEGEFYRLVQREADVEILPGRTTRVMGYDGIFPGPTIESRTGRPVVVRHVNELDVPTVVHLHGGHTPADSDGYPTDLILPAGMADAPHGAHGDATGGDVTRGHRDYAYPLRQRAATLWYHDHRMDFTGPQVYRGLAGFHIVRDDEDDALPLPKGEREIPLMLTDRAFDEDGAFRYPSVDDTLLGKPGVEDAYMEGVFGDVILVNGAPWPELEVDAARYRFRILNAANARRFALALDPPPREGAAFVQVGSDGGLLETPVAHDVLQVAPAERFDVVIDFGAYPVDTEITMTNRFAAGDQGRVMRFRVTGRAKDDTRVPERLSEFERFERGQEAVVRDFRFARAPLDTDQGGGGPGRRVWAINDKVFDPEVIQARSELGQVERWRFGTDVHHPVHLHLESFQVLRDGPYDQGWKDTVDVRPAEVVEVLVRFTEHAGKFVFHCHNLEHEDMMMMATFETH